MRTIRDLAALRARVRDWKSAGEVVGVVPTMGALHPGHLSLVAAAKAACDRVIVTLFVNPKQFNNPEDLKKYPRTLEADAELLDDHALRVGEQRVAFARAVVLEVRGECGGGGAVEGECAGGEGGDGGGVAA